ncbi:glycosyltransferase family 39 protein [Oerskovia jenensis]|uniref:glycosyltransferase family 39 protein n=1 Tax=Oerskovia jenensis TaxID=162169 RepID=UPI0036DBC839
MATTAVAPVPAATSTITGRSRTIEASLWGAAATLVGFALSWVPSLWTDEVVTQSVSSRTWSQTFALLDHRDAVHGLYYAVMHLWTAVLGTDPWVLRLPSAIACGVAVAGIYVLGTQLAGQATGRAAAAVAITLPALTWMSTEARSFAFVTAVTVWSYVALVTATRRGGRTWILYALAVVAAGLLFVQALLVVLAQGITILASSRRHLRPWLVTAASAGALLLPFVVFALGQRGQVAWLPPVGPETLRSVLFEQWFTGARRYGAVLLVMVAAAVVVGWVRARRGGRGLVDQVGVGAVAVPWAVVPTLVVLAVSVAAEPMYFPRYLAYTAPALALLVGGLLGSWRSRLARLAAVLVLVALAVPTYLFQRSETAKDNADWSQAASEVQAAALPGDVVLFSPDGGDERAPRRVLDAYPGAFAALEDPGLDEVAAEQGRFWDTGRPALEVLASADVTRAWLLGSHTDGLERELDETVAALEAEGWTVTLTWSGPSTRLYLVTHGV